MKKIPLTGDELKRKALDRHETRHADEIQHARSIARRLLAVCGHGSIIADDVRDVYERRDETEPPLLPWGAWAGAVFHSWEFEPCGFRAATRPSNHGCIVRAWRLRDMREEARDVGHADA
jgi:hypothetical protein